MMPRIRAEADHDIAAIAAIHEAAFGRRAEGELVAALRARAGWIPQLSLVAEVERQLVGHLLLTRIDIVGARPGQALALAPVGVMPEWQRRGIGSTLVRQSLANAAALGHRLVVVVGHPAYYSRFASFLLDRKGCSRHSRLLTRPGWHLRSPVGATIPAGSSATRPNVRACSGSNPHWPLL